MSHRARGHIDCVIIPKGEGWRNFFFGSPKLRLNVPHFIAGHVIPAGFHSDGASIPFGFHWIFNPLGSYAMAAVLHDFLLTTETRDFADKEFRKAMKLLKVPSWRVSVLFCAVHLFSRWKELENARL